MSSPAFDDIKVNLVPRHKNAQYNLYQAVCGNCLWESYLRPEKEEAEDIGEQHAANCTLRLNAEYGQTLISRRVPVRDLWLGDTLLTKSLAELRVIALAWTLGQFGQPDKALVTYTAGDKESSLLIDLDKEVGVL